MLTTHEMPLESKKVRKSVFQAARDLFTPRKSVASIPEPSAAKTFATNMHESSHWNDVDMQRLIIAAKQKSRNLRGEAFNCFVLPYSPYKTNSFEEFFTQLEKNIDSFTGENRFQLVIPIGDQRGGGFHWTTFDILIKDGALSVFSIDAANDGAERDALNYIINKFPGCTAYRVEADPLPGAKDRRRLIQSDNESCSRMALEHAFLLSKRNPFPQLAARELETEGERFKKTSGPDKAKLSFEEDLSESNIKLVRPTDLLAIAPACYRVTQSWKTLDSFKEDPVVSGKGLTLHEYADSHSTSVMAKGSKTKVNHSIAYKKERFIERTAQFYEQEGEAGVQASLEQAKAAPRAFATASAAERQKLQQEQLQRFPVKTQVDQIFHKFIKNNEANIENIEKRYRNFLKQTPQKELQQEARQQKKAEKRRLREENAELTAALKKIDKLLDKLAVEDRPRQLEALLALDMPARAKQALVKLQSQFQGVEDHPVKAREDKQQSSSSAAILGA